MVLVDPYALSEKNDKGEIQQPAKDLIEIIKDLPFKKLFLYCRQDAVHQPAFNALMAARGNKEIALLYGDFHDRYLIVGRNQTTASFNFISSSSYKTDYWKAYVFGASLNGVSKRPTYIVGLEKEDTAAVMKYINEVSPIQ